MTFEPNDEMLDVRGIQLAPSYGVFVRGMVKEHGPGLGSSVAYSYKATGKATIYIYDQGLTNVPEGPHSGLVADQFHAAIRDVFKFNDSAGRSAHLVQTLMTSRPAIPVGFLWAEFRVGGPEQYQPSFLALTGYRDNFLKVRVTLAPGAHLMAANEFVDDLERHLWGSMPEAFSGQPLPFLDVPDVRPLHIVALERARVPLFGPGRWMIERPGQSACVYRLFFYGVEREMANLTITNPTAESDEPDISTLTANAVPSIDNMLRKKLDLQFSTRGRTIKQWMGSQLNEAGHTRALVTAYIVEDGGVERQYIDVRLSDRGRKIFVSGSFAVSESDRVAVAVMNSLGGIEMLNAVH